MSSDLKQYIIEKPVLSDRKRVRTRARKQYFEEQLEKKLKSQTIDLTFHETLDDISDIFENKSEEKSLNDNEEKEKLEEKINRKPMLPPMCHCIECFSYMGESNPRQVCYKQYCSYEGFEEDNMVQIRVYHLRYSPYYNDPNFWGYKEYHDVIQEFIDKNYVESVSDNEN